MFADTPLHMIEDAEALEALVAKLRTRPIIGLDTEADSFHHYEEKLCLIQLSDLEADYIIDPLKVPDLSPLKALLEDEDVEVVLHGGDYDVVSLKRDFDIHINNIFDTMIAGQFLALPRISLADLIGRYFGHTIDKRYQRHDWARRPLEPEHLDYARGDTHFLLALREVLGRRLQQRGRTDAHREECHWLSLRSWSGRGKSDADFYRVKGSKKLDERGLRVLRAVWTYRDNQARRMDRPAFKVLPGDLLLKLASTPPEDEVAMARMMRPGSSMARRHGAGLLKAVAEGLTDQSTLPARPQKEGGARRARSSKGGPGVDRLFGPLKTWRNLVVTEQGLPPVVVANNALLKEIARVAPSTMDELSQVDGIRNWQIADFGEALLKIVQDVSDVAPEQTNDSKPKRRRRRRRRTKPSTD